MTCKMLKIIKKIIYNPRKAMRYLGFAIKKRLSKKRGILVFIGMDSSGEFDILYPGYKMCYGFEPNPERFEKLLRKYSRHKNIKLHNAAVTDYDGEIEFNISNNEGSSSSIGNFKEEWQLPQSISKVKMIKKIAVPCLNLLNYCQKNNITFIDDYISDIQGMDLQVLKTMKPMLDNRQIGTIRCEVTKDKYKNVYLDLPNNSEKGFQELLNENYQLIAKGLGILSPHKFDKIPEDVWEMDCMWNLQDK